MENIETSNIGMQLFYYRIVGPQTKTLISKVKPMTLANLELKWEKLIHLFNSVCLHIVYTAYASVSIPV